MAVRTRQEGPSLCQVFSQLRSKPEMCVLKVRRLHHLPVAASPDILKDHFSQFGHVDDAHLVYTQSKSQGPDAIPRCKLSGLGFLVMGSVEEAEAVLSSSEHSIQGVSITVERFYNLAESLAETAEAGQDVLNTIVSF